MRLLRPLLFSIPLVALMLSQSGCLLAAAAAGTGAGVMYVKGKTEAALDADPRAIADATDKAMRDMGISVISNESSSVDANIVGRTARDTKIEVTAKAITDRTSKVFIRAGVWGDEVLQQNLLNGIKSNLGLPPPEKTAGASG
jgi:ABC-type proline/glycine betaine transport system substrate-binding protein